jgi:hypothetical protein
MGQVSARRQDGALTRQGVIPPPPAGDQRPAGGMSLFTHVTEGLFTDIDHPWGCPNWGFTQLLRCPQTSRTPHAFGSPLTVSACEVST